MGDPDESLGRKNRLVNAFAHKSIRLASRGRRFGKQSGWSSMRLDESVIEEEYARLE